MTYVKRLQARSGAVVLLLALLFASLSASAQAEAIPGNVPTEAFGESIEGLDENTRELVLRCVDRALARMLLDFEQEVEGQKVGYLQILQTTIYVPDGWPENATDMEDKLWQEVYGRIVCAVDFVVIDNSLSAKGRTSDAEYSGRFGGYAITKHYEIEPFSLNDIRSRYFTEPLVSGVRVINMGSAYNAVYTTPIDAHKQGVPLFEYLNDSALTAFAENIETDFPVSVTVHHNGWAGRAPHTATDPETIRAVFEALRGITVLDEWPTSAHTDDELIYTFQMADGSTIQGFAFQDGMLLDEWMGLHELTGFNELQQALPDPGF